MQMGTMANQNSAHLGYGDSSNGSLLESSVTGDPGLSSAFLEERLAYMHANAATGCTL